MSTKYLISLFILISLPFLAKSQKANHDHKKLNKDTVFMFAFTAVDDNGLRRKEPNAAPGGAMDMSRYFGTYVYETLRPCGNEIYTSVADWISEHQLPVVKDAASPVRIELSCWNIDQTGLFEFTYTVHEDGSHARVCLDYFTLSGERLPPENIPDLHETYKLGALYETLRTKMACSE